MSKTIKPTTHVLMILDRSGSMHRIQRQAVDNYNEQRQQMIENSKDQNITMSFLTFNGNVFVHNWLSEPSSLPEAAYEDFVPHGGTAFNDAIGYGISRLYEETKDSIDENTGYLVLVISDGEELNSKHYSEAQVQELIGGLKATKRWTVSYMGCDEKALYGLARRTGIPIENMAVWSADSGDQARKTLRAANCRVQGYYDSRKNGMTFTSNLMSDQAGACANFVDPDFKPEAKSFMPVGATVDPDKSHTLTSPQWKKNNDALGREELFGLFDQGRLVSILSHKQSGQQVTPTQ